MNENKSRIHLEKALHKAYQFHTSAIDKSIDFYSSDRFEQDERYTELLFHLKWLKKAVQEFTVNIKEAYDQPILDEDYYVREEL